MTSLRRLRLALLVTMASAHAAPQTIRPRAAVLYEGARLISGDASAPDHFHAGGFVSAEIDLDQIGDHRAFAFLDRFHVRADRASVQSERPST